jgi:EAL domain-containing protein (putative c-di-GMP-specific phosphodiesterase class I)/DNA-binding response OmpR family regulator
MVNDHKYTILIVDDTIENIDILKEILKEEYHLKVALNGNKAVEIVQSDDKPDLVLLDVMMPGLDGFDVCTILKSDEKTSYIPIIFLTAKNSEEDEERGLGLGAEDFISKPFSPLIVKARIKTHLSIYAQHKYLINKANEDRYINQVTKLPNQVALHEELDTNRYKDSVIMLLSVDNIIKIRNTYGYNISDELMSTLSRYIQDEKYKNILKLYSTSYNTLALICKYDKNIDLQKCVQKFASEIENHSFKVSDSDIEFLLEVTIGVSNTIDNINNLKSLSQAENALSYAQENHLDMDIYNSSYQESISINKENIELAKEIKKGIEDDRLILHYQPIYSNESDTIEKYESLIRLECKDGTLMYPDKLIPISKQINKYNNITYKLIDMAFKFFEDKSYSFSVNISILDIYNNNFQKYMIEKLNEYDVQGRVVLEIVEQEGVEDYDIFFEFVKNMKELGCKIAIDDFGSGYSNFAYIMNMSQYIDYVKIDGTLIKDITTNEKNKVLVRAIRFICANLRIKTVAEYVEDKDILDYLKYIGIDFSQGYYIGKPIDKLV